jgi:hypothetical protein
VQPLRVLALVLFVGVAPSLAGCRGVEPPYPPGQPPAIDDLMAAASPALTSIQVPRAKVRQGGGPAANLMIVAQAPDRFAGTIQVSGNELVSLAVNEHEYGLRWLAGRDQGDALAPGYYSGPPSRCAVETLLGVDLEPEKLVELVLGGAPLIDEPHEILDRRWDRKTGRELLVITNGRFRQELSFAWFAGRWQFAGASLWATQSGSNTWLWTITHEQLHAVGAAILPVKTQIRRPKPSGRGETVIHVSFQKQIVNPSLGGELSADPPVSVDGDGPPPVNAGDTWDDDPDNDDGWESADGSEPDPDTQPPVEVAPKPAHPPAPARTIPVQFRGNPTGLSPRGDLCAGRR